VTHNEVCGYDTTFIVPSSLAF